VARAGLTPALVVAEAAMLADEVGLDRLTLTAVADRFGVATPSLYKHVAGNEGLRQALATAGAAALADALAEAALGRAGADALRAVATAYRAFAHQRPGLYEASLRAPDPSDADHDAAAARALAVVAAVLRGYGIVDDDAVVDAARAVRAALHGFVSLEAAGGFGLPRDVERSYDRLVVALDIALRAW
jgi:AcrR family transcriptional regulator